MPNRPRARRVMAEPRPRGGRRGAQASGVRGRSRRLWTREGVNLKARQLSQKIVDRMRGGGEQGQGPETDPRQPPSPRDHKLLHCCGKPGARNPLTAGSGTALPGECHAGLSAAPARLGARRTLLSRLVPPSALSGCHPVSRVKAPGSIQGHRAVASQPPALTPRSASFYPSRTYRCQAGPLLWEPPAVPARGRCRSRKGRDHRLPVVTLVRVPFPLGWE